MFFGCWFVCAGTAEATMDSQLGHARPLQAAKVKWTTQESTEEAQL